MSPKRYLVEKSAISVEAPFWNWMSPNMLLIMERISPVALTRVSIFVRETLAKLLEYLVKWNWVLEKNLE